MHYDYKCVITNIFKHMTNTSSNNNFTIIGYRFCNFFLNNIKFLFVTYTIIQNITSSEMCSLHLTHPSAHTLGAVGTVHSAVDAQEMLQHGHRM